MLKSGDRVLSIENYDISNWSDLTEAVTKVTENISSGDTISVTVETSSGKTETLDITPQENNGSYYIGVTRVLETGFWDKVTGGVPNGLAKRDSYSDSFERLVFQTLVWIN